MKTVVVFPRSLFESVKAYLLQDENERFAIILCGISRSTNQLRFLCREVIKAESKDLIRSSQVYVEVTDDFWRSALYRSKDGTYSILVCHSHPFSQKNVGFSSLDLSNDRENYEYVAKKIPKVFIGSLVFGQADVKGMFWDKDKTQISHVDEIRIIGQKIEKLSIDTRHAVFSKHAFDRQVRLFGEEGQKKLSETSVAIIGSGGLGSITTELVARLGTGNIVLVDDDVLEEPNLNRVIGSKPELIGTPKVEVLRKHIQTFSNAEIEVFEKSVLDPSVLQRLKDVDVIISGTDTQSSRMVLNELSVKYLIPYIDMAFGIFPEEQVEAYGQVRIVLPDSFCLHCIDGIDHIEASQELMSNEDKEMRREAGYIQGAPIPNPSVISLDSVIASLGVTEFLNLVCGIRPVNHYILYDMQSDNKIVSNILASKDAQCVLCGEDGEQGMGDLSPVKNHLENKVPDNIPQTKNKKKR